MCVKSDLLSGGQTVFILVTKSHSVSLVINTGATEGQAPRSTPVPAKQVYHSVVWSHWDSCHLGFLERAITDPKGVFQWYTGQIKMQTAQGLLEY